MMQYFAIVLLVLSSWTFSAQEKKYNSLFWEISGNGLEQSSYLYGTMHTQDERVFDFKPGVMEAFNQSEAYIMELNMDSIDRGSLMQSLIMEGDYSLKTLLSKEDYQLVEKFFRDSLGQALFLYNKMQPMFTSQLIGTKELQTQQEEALDIYFFKEAKRQEKKTYGLETMMEQVNAFSSIPYNKQAEELVNAVKNYGLPQEFSMVDLIEHYVNEDLDTLLQITLAFGDEDETMLEVFSNELLIKRNHHMADRAIPYIKHTSVFIAVGAAHLPGEEGVIELLRKKGYTITAR